MHRALSKRKYKDRKGTIHCAPTIQIQIKTINLYFCRTGVLPVYVNVGARFIEPGKTGWINPTTTGIHLKRTNL